LSEHGTIFAEKKNRENRSKYCFRSPSKDADKSQYLPLKRMVSQLKHQGVLFFNKREWE